MPDVSTSGPINGQFLSADEVQTSYVPVASRGFNQLVKTQRQGRWFLLKGNLQYQATTKTWRFADQQYHVIGMDNEKISETYSGWIDLFGWGTSGYDHGAVFLPVGGARLIDGIHISLAAYHTATAATECIWVLMFGEPLMAPGAHRGDGFSVRLAQDVE